MAEACKVVNKGKRKIAIEPITSKTKKQVTFSKRRVGLFKKASELCSMCGAEAAVITFSSAKKLFSFGNPSVDAIIHRYIGSNNSDDAIYEGNNDVKLGTLRPRGIDDGTYCGFWWDRSIDDLGFVELEQFKVALEGLRSKVVSRVEGINDRTSTVSSIVPQSLDFGNMDRSLVAQGIDDSSAWSNNGARDYEGYTGLMALC